MKKKNFKTEILEASACYVIVAIVFLTLASCTISFQNISTHGSATDLVDQNQKADSNVDLEVPLNKMGV